MPEREEWRDIPGYEGLYQVSSKGRVRSMPRTVTQRSRWGGMIERPMRGRVLTPWKHSKDERPWVSLSRNGEVAKLGVHVLVALAFHGEPPPGKGWALHRDGDSFNNAPENIYWGDSRDNVQDAIRHGTHAGMTRTHCPREHLLSHPNLKRAKGRECRACSNASEWIRGRRGRGLHTSEQQRREYADKRYREIMAAVDGASLSHSH